MTSQLPHLKEGESLAKILEDILDYVQHFERCRFTGPCAFWIRNREQYGWVGCTLFASHSSRNNGVLRRKNIGDV